MVSEERAVGVESADNCIFETRGVVESQPPTRMPGDGSDACTLICNSALEAGVGGGANSAAALVTGLPPSGTLKRNKQRRIEVDYSLLHEDETFSQASTSRAAAAAASATATSSGTDSRKVVTKENDQNAHNVVPLRRRKWRDCY